MEKSMKVDVFGRMLAASAAAMIGAASMAGGGIAAHAADASPGATISASGLGQSSLASFLAAHGSCDDYGYIYAVTGLTTSGGSLDGSDVPSTITVSFSDGSSAVAQSRGVSGSSATYIDGLHHQS